MKSTNRKQIRMIEKELQSLREQRSEIDFKMRLLRNTLKDLKGK